VNMSASVRFSVTFMCDVCKATATGSALEGPLLDGLQVPNPSLPEGWIERRGFLRTHYCSDACEERAARARRAHDAPAAAPTVGPNNRCD